MSIFEGKMCQLFTMNAYLQQHHASCSMRVIILLVSFIALMMMVEACDSSCHNDSHHMVLCVYSSRPVAPSAVTLHRMLTAIAHRYIAVECIVRVYFICIYRLLIISISINAIVLYYFRRFVYME